MADGGRAELAFLGLVVRLAEVFFVDVFLADDFLADDFFRVTLVPLSFRLAVERPALPVVFLPLLRPFDAFLPALFFLLAPVFFLLDFFFELRATVFLAEDFVREVFRVAFFETFFLEAAFFFGIR